MKFRVLGTMLGVALLAGACSDARLIDNVEAMKPTEKGFKFNLHHQYLTLANLRRATTSTRAYLPVVPKLPRWVRMSIRTICGTGVSRTRI